MNAVQGSGGFSPDDETPVFVISVAAQLAGMHAQTLRQYDRLGLVSPSRTRGGGRRYSARDVTLLREVQRLSQDEGVSLAGHPAHPGSREPGAGTSRPGDRAARSRSTR